MKPLPRIRQIALNIGVSFGAFIVTLLFVELAVRVVSSNVEFYDAYEGEPTTHYYRYSNNQEISLQSENEFNFTHTTNELGFFGRSIPSRMNYHSIVAFGDSFTQGVGADSTESWPCVLERCLRKSDDSIRVYNCGIGGSDPLFNFVVFRDIIIPRKPRHVILCINPTDLDETVTRGGMERFCADGSVKYKTAPFKHSLFKWSKLFNLAATRALNYNYLAMSPSEYRKEVGFAQHTLARSIDAFHDLAVKNKIGFTLVILPFPASTGARVATDANLELPISNRIDQIDLFPFFNQLSQNEDIDDYYWILDGHFNSNGYEQIGNVLCDRLVWDSP